MPLGPRSILLLALSQMLTAPVVRAQLPAPDTSAIPLPFKGHPRPACEFVPANAAALSRTSVPIGGASWRLPARMIMRDQWTKLAPVAHASLTTQWLRSADDSLWLRLERGSLEFVNTYIGLSYRIATPECTTGACLPVNLGCSHCLDVQHRCETVAQGRPVLIAWAGSERISYWWPASYTVYAAFDLGNGEWFTLLGIGHTPAALDQWLALVQSVQF